MNHQKPYGEENSPEHLATSTAELYALLTSPFERPFESLGYSADLSLHVSHGKPIHSEAKKQDFEFLTGKRIDPEKVWSLKLGYNPETDSVGIKRLTIPVLSSRNEVLIMEGMLDGTFIPIIESAEGDTRPSQQPIAEMEDMLDPKPEGFTSTYALDKTMVEQILFDAGYFIPEASSSPDSLQLQIVAMLDSSQQWTVQETIDSMLNGQTQMTTHRMLSQRTSGASTVKSAGRNSRPRNSRLASQADISVETIIEDFVQPGEEREQLVIIFEGEDYSVNKPLVKRRTLKFDESDATIASFGEGQYKVVQEKEQAVTAAILDKLLSYVVVQMIGD
jgi:hypothetical protein